MFQLCWCFLGRNILLPATSCWGRCCCSVTALEWDAVPQASEQNKRNNSNTKTKTKSKQLINQLCTIHVSVDWGSFLAFPVQESNWLATFTSSSRGRPCFRGSCSARPFWDSSTNCDAHKWRPRWHHWVPSCFKDGTWEWIEVQTLSTSLCCGCE